MLNYFSGSFLLFKGTLMDSEWIEDWRQNIEQKFYLNGITSTTKNLEVALDFSKCDKSYGEN